MSKTKTYVLEVEHLQDIYICKNRMTGYEIKRYTIRGEAGSKIDYHYYVTCQKHKTVIEVRTKSAGTQKMRTPWEWCPICSDMADEGCFSPDIDIRQEALEKKASGKLSKNGGEK